MCPPNTKYKGCSLLATSTRGPVPGPLRTPRSQSVLPTIQNWMTPMHKHGTQRRRGCGVGAAAPPPIFRWQSGEMSHSGEFTIIGHGGSMESLVEMVQIENLLQSYVNFTLGGNRFSWTFKVLKPTNFWGLCTLDPARDVPQTSPGALKNFWSC